MVLMIMVCLAMGLKALVKRALGNECPFNYESTELSYGLISPSLRFNRDQCMTFDLYEFWKETYFKGDLF